MKKLGLQSQSDTTNNVNTLTITTEARGSGCCVQSYQITIQKNRTFCNRDFCTAVAQRQGAIQQRLRYPQTLQSCPDLFISALGFYPMTDWRSSQNTSCMPHRPMEVLPKTLLKLQGSIIDLAFFTCYLSLSL